MGIVSALYTGVSGMKAFGTAMQVIGHNLANTNTTGFKASRTQFADMLYQQVGGARNQVGLGTKVQSVSRVFSQGAFANTEVNTDLAIEGRGFFQVQNGDMNYYTRDGQFRVDNDGFVVNSMGYRLMGFQFDQDGALTPATGPINLANQAAAPRATTRADLSVNLNAESLVPTPFDPQNPIDTSNYSTSMRIYDTLGAAHESTVFFSKTDDQNWSWNAMVPMSQINPASPRYDAASQWYRGASGTLEFNESGALVNETQQPAATLAFDFAGGPAQGQFVRFDFGDSINPPDNGTGLEGSTQFATPNTIASQVQDGFAAGNLVSIGISDDGVVSGLFSNGRTRPIARVALAQFTDELGLKAIGNNMFGETIASGQPTLLAPGEGAAGTVTSNALELSNVDIANEFVQMIQNQRAFQANSRTISVSDQLLQEAVNLIR